MQIWRYEGETKKLLRYDVRNLKGSVCVRALIFQIFVYNIYRAWGIYILFYTVALLDNLAGAGMGYKKEFFYSPPS